MNTQTLETSNTTSNPINEITNETSNNTMNDDVSQLDNNNMNTQNNDETKEDNQVQINKPDLELDNNHNLNLNLNNSNNSNNINNDNNEVKETSIFKSLLSNYKWVVIGVFFFMVGYIRFFNCFTSFNYFSNISINSSNKSLVISALLSIPLIFMVYNRMTKGNRKYETFEDDDNGINLIEE